MEENNLQQSMPEQPVQQPVYEQPVQQPVYEQPAQQPVYEQPVQQPVQQPVPPVYSAVPPAQPAADGGKKKGKGALIAIIAVLVILLLAVGGILIYKMVGGNPKARLTKGLNNLAKELDSYGNPLEDEIDFTTITQKMLTEAYTMDIKLDVSVPDSDSMMDTVGVDITSNSDIPNKLMEAEMKASVANIELLKMNMTADDNMLYVSLPDFLKDTYAVDTETLGKDYNASAWAEILGMEVDDSLSFDLFAEAKKAEVDDTLLADEIAEIAGTMTVEDSGNVVEIERGGKTIRCDGVKVTLNKDALNAFLDALFDAVLESDYMQSLLQQELIIRQDGYDGYMDEADLENMLREEFQEAFSVRFKSDVELCFYMDGKNRIVNIATPSRIKLKDSMVTSIGFSLVFSGTDRVLDDVSGTVKMSSEEREVKMEIERTAKLTKDAYENEFALKLTNDAGIDMGLKYSADWDLEDKSYKMALALEEEEGDSLSFLMKGDFTDIEKGKSVKMNIGELSLSEDDEKMLGVSGYLFWEPFDGEMKAPKDAVDLLGMSETEIEDAISEFSQGLYQLLLGY